MNRDAVIQKALSTIEEYEMFREGDWVLAAVSGGADSVCLLDLLNSIQKEKKLKIAVAHLHHGLRGADADADAEFVRSLAKRYHCPYHERRINVGALAKERKLSVEAAGREARYQFFLALAKEEGYQKIATAHNQNDLAETVLMRMMRGTGIDGLCGISANLEDLVVRPLLAVSREEIEAYCSAEGLSYQMDQTNNDNRYTRNKIRNQILPLMQEINPNVTVNIAQMAVNLREDAKFLNAYAERLYQTLNNPHPSHRPTLLHIASLQMVGISIQSRLVRIAAQEVMGKRYRLEQKHIYSVLALLEKQTGSQISLPGGLSAAVRYGWLELTDEKKAVTSAFLREAIEVAMDRIYEFAGIGKKVSFSIQEMQTGEIPKSDAETFYFDADKLQGKQLLLRTRRTGDKIAVFSGGGEKTLKRLMIDMKIPRSLRDEIPVLTADGEVIALLGYRISEKFKAEKSSGKMMVVRYEGY